MSDRATEPPTVDITVNAQVAVDMETLKNDSGVTLLKDRVEQAAYPACYAADPLITDDGTCVRNAVKSAAPQIDAIVARQKHGMRRTAPLSTAALTSHCRWRRAPATFARISNGGDEFSAPHGHTVKRAMFVALPSWPKPCIPTAVPGCPHRGIRFSQTDQPDDVVRPPTMAIWQCDFELLPIESIDRPACRRQPWPARISLAALAHQCDAILAPIPCPVPSSLRQWGSMDGDRIDLLSKHDTILEAFVRLDARNVSLGNALQLRTMAIRNDLALAGPNTVLIKPSLSQMITELLTSEAFRFVNGKLAM